MLDRGDDERLKLMAIRTLKDLVVGASEEQKLAVVGSGVLSELHRLLEKPLPKIVSQENTDSSSGSPILSTPSELSEEPGLPPDNQGSRDDASPSDPPADQNTSAIKQPADAVLPASMPKVDRAIELRDSAFAILAAIATGASDSGMEIIADAYVHAGIHIALVDLLRYAVSGYLYSFS